MMRIFGLIVLGLLAFVITFVAKFPAAGVLPHVDISPHKVSGVSGSIWRGQAAEGSSPQLTVPVQNVNWQFSPALLLQASAGANLQFETLGGNGSGVVSRKLDGEMNINDAIVRLPASSLQQFLPLPVAEFGGVVNAQIDNAQLRGQILQQFSGLVTWRNAAVTGAVNANLGSVSLEVRPQGDSHRGKISNADGDLDVNGELQLDQNGDFKTDIRIKPNTKTPAELNGVLGMLGKRSSDGSYRIRNSGNLSEFI